MANECVQTMSFTDTDGTGHEVYHQCGKVAKYEDNDGRLLCGRHKGVVNKVYERMGVSYRCEPLAPTDAGAK